MRPQNPAIRVDLPPDGRPHQKVSQNRLSSGGIKTGAKRTCSKQEKVHAVRPKLVIFDEPRRRVDVGAIAEISWLMMAWPVIIISSHLPEIMNLSDRILLTRQGRMAEEFTARQERINICSGALKFLTQQRPKIRCNRRRREPTCSISSSYVSAILHTATSVPVSLLRR